MQATKKKKRLSIFGGATKAALPRENSAANRLQLERDPREEARRREKTAAVRSDAIARAANQGMTMHGESAGDTRQRAPTRKNSGGSGKAGRNTNYQDQATGNSALNRSPVVGEPRREKQLKGVNNSNGDGGSSSGSSSRSEETPPRNNNTHFIGTKGAPSNKPTLAHFQDYKIEEIVHRNESQMRQSVDSTEHQPPVKYVPARRLSDSSMSAISFATAGRKPDGEWLKERQDNYAQSSGGNTIRDSSNGQDRESLRDSLSRRMQANLGRDKWSQEERDIRLSRSSSFKKRESMRHTYLSTTMKANLAQERRPQDKGKAPSRGIVKEASYRAGDIPESEPMTRPSEPARHRRKQHRVKSFDVEGTREAMITNLRSQSSHLDDGGGGGNASTDRDDFPSTLMVSLIDMGFSSTEIEMAIEVTGATSSRDADEVMAWLEESRKVVPTIHESDEEEACNETATTLYTKQTCSSAVTSNTNATEESDEQVAELATSLNQLGFSRDEVRKHKATYRRFSNRLNPQDFIMTMLDADDAVNNRSDTEGTEESESSSSEDDEENNARTQTFTGGTNNTKDSELIKTITDMGFNRDRVEGVIIGMRNSGEENLDADKILCVLLGGDSGSGAGPSSGRRSTLSGSPGTYVPASRPKRTTMPLVKKHGRRPPSPSQNHGRSSSSPAIDEPTPDMNEESVTIELAPGQFAQLLKGRHTWNAMHNGTAVSESCIICQQTLQCTPQADHVLCPDCDVVSPLRMGGKGSGRRNSCGYVGLGYKR